MNRSPVIPKGCEHFLSWFWDLSGLRQSTMDGPAPLRPSDIAGWAAITGAVLSREDIATLRTMDAAYIGAVGKESDDRARAAAHQSPP